LYTSPPVRIPRRKRTDVRLGAKQQNSPTSSNRSACRVSVMNRHTAPHHLQMASRSPPQERHRHSRVRAIGPILCRLGEGLSQKPNANEYRIRRKARDIEIIKESMLEYFGKDIGVKEIDDDKAREWRDFHLTDNELSNSSVNKYLDHVAGAFRWGADRQRKYVEFNPFEKKQLPKALNAKKPANSPPMNCSNTSPCWPTHICQNSLKILGYRCSYFIMACATMKSPNCTLMTSRNGREFCISVFGLR